MLDAAECPPTFGTPPEMVVGIIAGGLPALVKSIEGAEDDVNAGIGEMDAPRVGPARRGRRHRRERHDALRAGGARAGAGPRRPHGVSCRCSEPPAPAARDLRRLHHRPVGPEVVTGSTRMKAGTATKLVLNTLTTGAMIRLGKTYGNLMVDLRAWNDKLIDRSQRILMETTGLGRDESARRCSRPRTEASRPPSSWRGAAWTRARRSGCSRSTRAGSAPSSGDPPPVRHA